jgi:hypothetical protein
MLNDQDFLCPGPAHGLTPYTPAKQGAPPPFALPQQSRATRKFSYKSRERCSGSLVIDINGKKFTLHFESKLELMVIMMLLGRGDVVDVWEQPPHVTYLKADGSIGKHTYDFRVVLDDGSVVAVAVKPAEKAARAAFQADIARVAQATPKSFANDVVVMSEADFTHAQVVNATRYFEFSKDTDIEADLAVQGVVADLSGVTSIDGIVRRTKLAGRAYRAVVRAIFAKTLMPAADGIISPKTIVSPSHAGGRF